MIPKLALLFGLLGAGALFAADQPNIVVIYADDLGYGDVGAYGATAIPTPHFDRLAAEGVRFTNGYSPSAICTPSRYSLLTGHYPWRREGNRVLPGEAAMIIEPGSQTLPAMLRDAGYHTGVVGKWHLGLGDGETDWNGRIAPGPLEIGFDESFLMPATGDRVPCVFVEGHHVVGLDLADPIEVRYGEPIPGVPTGRDNPELLRIHPSHGHDHSIVDGISRIGYMKGGHAARWHDEDIADRFTDRAVRFIEESRDRPFFLYFSLHDPHVPRVPHPRFVGATDLGPRGDAIVQADWCAGEIMRTLERLRLKENTLVILSSDNGPVLNDGYQDQSNERNGDHMPAGVWRGGKYSKYEAGCRVPFVVSWPARVAPGESAALVSQVDLVASLARLAGQSLRPGAARDSVNVLPALLGESSQGRESLVLHSRAGLSLRRGPWKYIPASGGPLRTSNTHIELGNSPDPQLYNLEEDPGETRNLASAKPQVVAQLDAELQRIESSYRTRE